jgi:hypothetical protein
MSIIFDRHERNLKDSVKQYMQCMQMGNTLLAESIYAQSVLPNLMLYKQSLQREVHFGTTDIFYGYLSSSSGVIYLKSYRRI